MIKKNLIIKGKRIFLRSLKEKDVYGNWWRWFNDPEVTRHMNKGHETNTVEKQLAFFRHIHRSKRNFGLAICDINTEKHIGTTGIHDIRTEEDRKVGSFGIVIGEKEYWGKGIGTEAWYLMIEYAFDNLNLDIIKTKIFSQNITSLKIAKRLGFIVVDVLKKDIIKNGRKIDRMLLSLKKEFWYQNIKGNL